MKAYLDHALAISKNMGSGDRQVVDDLHAVGSQGGGHVDDVIHQAVQVDLLGADRKSHVLNICVGQNVVHLQRKTK